VSRLVADLEAVAFPDGSVCDVRLWLSEEPAPEAVVFAAMVVLRDRDDRYAVVWSPRRREWGAPGGWREAGEDVVACAVREVAEETGLRLAPESLSAVGHEEFAPRTILGRWPEHGGVLQVFSATVDAAAPALATSEPDAEDPRWVSAQEFEELAGRQFWWPLVASALSP